MDNQFGIHAQSSSLLIWYDRHGRDLPWRKTRDGYALWVSEIMLQQTTVEVVIPYYEAWMRDFPDVKRLAAADLDAVMKHWEGLGYYSRALSLHRAARRIVEKGGRLPDNEAAWRLLPGVGAYTAAALAAIVNGERVVAVDAPVRRVLYRFLGMEGNADSQKALAEMRREGLVLISPSRPGDSAQALMDLAAALCKRKAPDCNACPIAKHCAAHWAGNAEILPPGKPPVRETIEVAVGLWLRRETVYLQRRPEGGLFAGLWELPGGKVETSESPREAVVREFQEELGRKVRVVLALPPVRHAYTRFRVTLHPFIVRGRGGVPKKNGKGGFVPLNRVGDYAQPAANERIWKSFFTQGYSS